MVLPAAAASRLGPQNPSRIGQNVGGGGNVTTPVGRGSTSVSALVQEPDGKLVAVGSGAIGSGMNVKSSYIALVRYDPNGGLDASFGHGGKVTTSIGRFTSASAIVRQPDRRLVVAGTSASSDSNDRIALVRYESNGSLDASFGHRGKVTTAFEGITLNAISTFVVRQPDAKLVAASSGYRGAYSYLTLARYRSDGSLDTTFGHGGKVTTRINQLDYNPSALLLQPDGKLVAAAGTSSAQGSGGYVLVRYDKNGSLDTRFGRGGKITAAGTTNNDIYEGLVLGTRGELVAAGAGSYSALALAAYDENGKPDTTFGHNGKVTTVLSPGAISYNGVLVAASGGKVLAAGQADLSQAGPSGSFIIRYESNGSLDRSFGRRGKVTTTLDGGGLSGALLRQRDGKLVVAGSSAQGSGFEFALARFDSNGGLDTSFGG